MDKKTVHNFIYNTAYKILIIIVPLLTAPYISRVLHPNGVGIYSYTFTLATAFSLLAALGINTYGQREIAYYQQDKEKRSTIFWELVTYRFITTTIVLIGYFVFSCVYQEYRNFLLEQAFIVVAVAFDISWYFQGVENFKIVVIRNAAIKIVTLVCIFSFVKTENDLGLYILINSVSTFLSNAIYVFSLKNEVCRVPLRSIELKKHTSGMFGFFIPLIAVEIYSQLDKIMLGAITTGSLENGYYEQARKITSIVVSIVTSINTVLLSRVANLYINNQKEQIIDYYKRSVRFIYLLLFPMCVGMLVISQNFTAWFFGADYGKVATLLDLSCPLLFFMCIGNFVGVQYLSPMEMQNKMTKAYLTAAAVNFCLNLLLIPRLYSVGALIASIIAEAGSCFIQLYYFAKSEYAIPLWKPMWKYTVSALVMGVALLGFNAILPVTGALQTVADIVVGGIVYAACLILLREELVCMVLKTVKVKQKNRSFIK